MTLNRRGAGTSVPSLVGSCQRQSEDPFSVLLFFGPNKEGTLPKVRAEDACIGGVANKPGCIADQNPFNIKAPHLVQVVQYVFSSFVGITGRQRDQKREGSQQQQLMLKIEANLVGDVPHMVKMLFLKSRKD
jgi:hypothetical protein